MLMMAGREILFFYLSHLALAQTASRCALFTGGANTEVGGGSRLLWGVVCDI